MSRPSPSFSARSNGSCNRKRNIAGIIAEIGLLLTRMFPFPARTVARAIARFRFPDVCMILLMIIHHLLFLHQGAWKFLQQRHISSLAHWKYVHSQVFLVFDF